MDINVIKQLENDFGNKNLLDGKNHFILNDYGDSFLS